MRSSWAPRAAWIPTIVLLAVMLLAEVGLRLARYNGEPWDYPAGTYYVRDARLFWRLRPGFDGEWGKVRVTITDQGLRSPWDPGWAASPERIACIGDSIPFGFYVSGEDAFPGCLSSFLKETQTPAAVANAGVPGYTSCQMERYLPDVLDLQPTTLIVATGGYNESLRWKGIPDEEVPSGFRTELGILLERSRVFLFLKKLIHPVTTHAGSSSLGQGEDLVELSELWDVGTPRVTPEAHEKHLRGICEKARQRGVNVIFLITPLNPYFDPGPPSPLTGDFLERYLKARKLAESGDLASSVESIDAMLQDFPDVAYLWFKKAEIQKAMGDETGVGESYRKAYELSPRCQRLKAYQDAARRVAQQQGIPLVDALSVLQAQWFQPGQMGTGLLFDYCHPTREGHRLIAESLLSAIRPGF